MERWADHCSSDEEELKRIPSASQFAFKPESSESEPEIEPDEDDGIFYDEAPAPTPAKIYNVPTEPPYTAYVANLSYNIPGEKELANEMEKICYEQLRKVVHVVDARLVVDRETKKRKGYGYVEFKTADDLRTVLELNDRNILIFGRKIRVDVAQSSAMNQGGSRRSTNRNLRRQTSTGSSGAGSSSNLNKMNIPDNIDGSKFLGGIFNRGSSGNLKQQQHQQQPTERAKHGTSHGSTNSNTTEERPRRLNLKPRTKPIKTENDALARSSIFGDGKARDAQTWQPAKKEADYDADNEKKSKNKANGVVKNGNENKAAVASGTPAVSTGANGNANKKEPKPVQSSQYTSRSTSNKPIQKHTGKGGRGGGSPPSTTDGKVKRDAYKQNQKGSTNATAHNSSTAVSRQNAPSRGKKNAMKPTSDKWGEAPPITAKRENARVSAEDNKVCLLW